MKSRTYLSIVLLLGLALEATSAYANVIRVTLNELKSSSDFHKYAKARAQNDKYLRAQPGFVSITWFSDPDALMAGAAIVFKTRKEMLAAYDTPHYKAFYKKGLEPYVKARTVHIYNVDHVH